MLLGRLELQEVLQDIKDVDVNTESIELRLGLYKNILEKRFSQFKVMQDIKEAKAEVDGLKREELGELRQTEREAKAEADRLERERLRELRRAEREAKAKAKAEADRLEREREEEIRRIEKKAREEAVKLIRAEREKRRAERKAREEAYKLEREREKEIRRIEKETKEVAIKLRRAEKEEIRAKREAEAEAEKLERKILRELRRSERAAKEEAEKLERERIRELKRTEREAKEEAEKLERERIRELKRVEKEAKEEAIKSRSAEREAKRLEAELAGVDEGVRDIVRLSKKVYRDTIVTLETQFNPYKIMWFVDLYTSVEEPNIDELMLKVGLNREKAHNLESTLKLGKYTEAITGISYLEMKKLFVVDELKTEEIASTLGKSTYIVSKYISCFGFEEILKFNKSKELQELYHAIHELYIIKDKSNDKIAKALNMQIEQLRKYLTYFGFIGDGICS